MDKKLSKKDWFFAENNFFSILFILGFIVLFIGAFLYNEPLLFGALGWTVALATYQTLKD